MTLIKTYDFETHFKRHYRPLCLYAMRYVEQLDDAEDIVQQAFADVWAKNKDNQTIINLKAYLYQTVRNRSLSFIAESPHLRCAESLEDIEDISEDEKMLRAERDARLWTAIDKLPSERRKIFLLSKRDGLKYQEIAEELNISVKTVENQMSKALKTLRETAIRIYLFFFG
ncbi:RNA polymerase sigma-70 factor [Parabacteroides sp. OttesenSCG-928-G21]|nr:RNA polymerase sigma-70 factor [Parabacteroides sp. OttesenSCG-928-G21]